MKSAGFLRLTLIVPLALAAQQPPLDDPRDQAIVAKHKRGEKVTEEERDYHESKIERRNQAESAIHNADRAKQHPSRESTGLIPLPDLGAATYKGEPGGLYPGAVNNPPQAHLQAGIRLAVWKREDPGPDGTHPSIPGREKSPGC